MARVWLGRRGRSDHDRGLTPVVAFVLVVGLVAIVSVGIFLAAGDAITESERQAELEHAEQAFVDVSKQFRTSSISEEPRPTVDLGVTDTGGRVRTVEGSINVTVGNQTILPGGTARLDAVEYVADDGTTIAYQGGGVWRSDGGHTSIVRQPNDIEFTNRTLNLPIMNVTADQHYGSGPLTLRSVGGVSHHSGLVDDGPVTVRVTSTYADGWVRYFELAFPHANVSLESGNPDTAVVSFEAVNRSDTSPPPVAGSHFDRPLNVDGDLAVQGSVTGDVWSTGDATINASVDGDLFVDGAATIGTQPTQVGSVIARGDVDAESRVDGDIISTGDVTLTTRADPGVNGSIIAVGDVIVGSPVNGSVVAYGDVHVTVSDDRIGGDIVANGSITGGNSTYEGMAIEEILNRGYVSQDIPDEVDQRLNLSMPAPIDTEIDDAVAEGRSNSSFNGELRAGDRLGSGVHYYESIEIDSSDVPGPRATTTFDVGGGNITLYVDGDIDLRNNANIRVENAGSGNVVRIYTTGNFSTNYGASVCPGTHVHCPSLSNSDARVIQLYGKSSSFFEFRRDSEFHGIIFAPQGADDTLKLDGDGHKEFFGSIVTGGYDADGDINVIHDEKLADLPGPDPNPRDPVSRIRSGNGGVEYLHVTTHEVVAN